MSVTVTQNACSVCVVGNQIFCLLRVALAMSKINDYEVLRSLGLGAFGTVSLVRLKQDGRQVCVISFTIIIKYHW